MNIEQEYKDVLAVLRKVAPGGKIEGEDYVALNPRRDDKSLGSFRFNLRTQAWADFALVNTGKVANAKPGR